MVGGARDVLIRRAELALVLKQLSESKKDFLPRLIAYFDGEKDPRNLMIVFSILNVPMVEWDVSGVAQVSMAEHSIPNLDLLTAVRKCSMPCSITSQSHFALHQTTLMASRLKI